DLGVARRALEALGRDVDLSPGAVLRRAPAVRALLVRDLVARTRGARAWSDRPAAQRLDEVRVADLRAALGSDRRARLPPQCVDLGRQLDPHHAGPQVGVRRILRLITGLMAGDQALDLVDRHAL